MLWRCSPTIGVTVEDCMLCQNITFTFQSPIPLCQDHNSDTTTKTTKKVKTSPTEIETASPQLTTLRHFPAPWNHIHSRQNWRTMKTSSQNMPIQFMNCLIKSIRGSRDYQKTVETYISLFNLRPNGNSVLLIRDGTWQRSKKKRRSRNLKIREIC